jgi:hypothetical protein
MGKKRKKSQASIEYLMIVSFVTFSVIMIMTIALLYSSSIKDRIKATQVNNFANKIIATSESVFYSGEPAKATITCYLPESVRDIEITQNNIFITFSTSSGENKIGFQSDVPISEGANILSNTQGMKRIEVKAEAAGVVINQVY